MFDVPFYVSTERVAEHWNKNEIHLTHAIDIHLQYFQKTIYFQKLLRIWACLFHPHITIFNLVDAK